MKQKKSMPFVDFKKVKHSISYHDTYSNYLSFFKELKSGVICKNVPKSWIPLILYLGADVESFIYFFNEDRFAHDLNFCKKIMNSNNDFRFFVEYSCILRPELVDALWKIDNQWKKTSSFNKMSDIILVTNTNSFYRKEITDFIELVSTYKSKFKKCVITNCSADKPYPSKTHIEIKKLFTEHELLVVSGVTGIVPECFFNYMPNYDAGIPNLFRVKLLSEEFFKRNFYEEIVILTEFNQFPLNEVIYNYCKNSKIISYIPHEFRTDYFIDDKYLIDNEATFRRF